MSNDTAIILLLFAIVICIIITILRGYKDKQEKIIADERIKKQNKSVIEYDNAQWIVPQEIARALQNMPLEDKNDPLNIQIRANILTEFLKTRVLCIEDNTSYSEKQLNKNSYQNIMNILFFIVGLIILVVFISVR